MKRFKLFLLGVICLLFMPSMVRAASGSISVSGTSSAVVGNRVTMTVTLSSSTGIGSWEMALNYDKSYLQLVSSTAESGGTKMLGYTTTLSGVKSKSYTFVFKTLKTGSTRVSVSSYLAYAMDESEISLTSSSKTISIITQEQLEASYSKNNNLRDISVTVGEEEYTLDQEFDADTLEYTVTVPTGTTLVNVEATRADSTASVDGTGEIEVTEGLNTIPIVVTAQNGDEKTYTLVVNVEDQNPINVSVDGVDYTVVKSNTLLEAPVTFTETTIQIDGFDIPAFTNSSIGYTLVGLKDASGDITLYRYQDGEYTYYNQISSKSYLLIPVAFSTPLNYTFTNIEINGVTYDAYKYSENSNYVIINALNLENNEENYYLYDPSSGAMMLFDDTFIKEANQTINYYTYVIIAFAGALFLMLILIFALLHSTKKKQKKINHFIEKQEAKLEATRKLNDVVSEVKKITEETEDENSSFVPQEVKIEEEHSDTKEEAMTFETKENHSEDSNSENPMEGLEEPVKKSKKEQKQERKEAKRKTKEEKKREKQDKSTKKGIDNKQK